MFLLILVKLLSGLYKTEICTLRFTRFLNTSVPKSAVTCNQIGLRKITFLCSAIMLIYFKHKVVINLKRGMQMPDWKVCTVQGIPPLCTLGLWLSAYAYF